MSWQSLIKPPGKDPKNINEWLALITEKIRELKQTENWYDVSRVITTSSIVDSLDSHRSDAILSANQGRTLKELIDEIEVKITELSKNSHIDIAKLKESLDENIPKIASNIQSITDLINRLNTLSNDVTGNRQNIESINTRLTEITSKISTLESSLNVLSDRIIKNNDAITKKVEGLETKVDQNLVKVNNEIAGITSDIGQIVGGNEILTGLNVTISSENVITTTEGKVIINGDVISINKSLSINVTTELLNRDSILMLTLKINSQKQPILALEENISADEVLISKLSIIDGKIVNNSKMEVLQPMNTMVGLAAENEADTIRETIPSGFTRLGELDYEYMINHENEVKIKSESVAYVNGYKVVIPKDTIINIGKAPEKESREDLLFLEAWKDEDFPKTGKVKWRIRHVVNVDFYKYKNDGFNSALYIDWGCINTAIVPQGGNIEPVNPATSTPQDRMFCNCFSDTSLGSEGFVYYWYRKDIGLYIAGHGNDLSKTTLKTIDGRAYAIPMFRLYRKPSCGKSIPFEYSKINPKVDYSKFAKLMKEEKVERVVSENIQGLSLINLYDGINFIQSSDNVSKVIMKNNLFKKNTLYTICVAIKSSTLLNNVIQSSFLRLQGLNDTDGGSIPGVIWGVTGVVTQNYKNIVETFTTPGNLGTMELIFRNCYTDWGLSANTSYIKDIMILEGDWTNKKLPQHFEGLKSLGEDDGNLITIKNGILDDDTYDVNDGNQKLTTFSQVTHVLSENNIIPKVEADLKRGEHKISTLTEFKKLDTIGDEKVEFTKIKGRTIQNCYPIITRDSFSSNFSGTIEDGCVVLQGSGTEYKNAFIHITKCLIKPDTNYTVVIDVIYNTLVHDLVIASALTDDVFNATTEPFTKVGSGKVGTYKYLVKSARDITNDMNGLRSYLSIPETGKIKFKIMLLEGDHRTTPLNELTFVNGIKSLGEDENNIINLSTLGKNLFNPTKCIDGVALSQQEDLYNDSGLFASEPIEVIPENKITLTKVKWGWLLDSNMRKIGSNFGDGNSIQKTLSLPSNCHYIRVSTSIAEKEQVQIEYGESATNYQQYKKYNQNIHLKEPLRSLPNGIHDEIVGNKVIRRVGKFVLNGSELWTYQPQNSNRINTLLFTCNPPSPPKTSYLEFTNVLCNRFTCLKVWSIDSPGIYTDETIVGVAINKSELSNKLSVDGFTTWLSQNPTTVYYELATPLEEYLENVYDKESIKTYQLDASLRSLPNGVKDEIKDGVLIRRCGEIILDGNMYFSNFDQDRHGQHTYYAQTTFPNCKSFASIITDKLIWRNDMWWNSNDVEGIHCHTNTTIQIRLLKTKITDGTFEGFKNYLNNNPIKVIYELAIPIETSLIEVKPQTANFSIQRQFAEGNWLRELPNGVKDTIENGKVIRRVGKIILNGIEKWYESSNNIDNYINFYTETTIDSNYAINNLDVIFKCIHNHSEMLTMAEGIYSWNDTKRIEIRLSRNRGIKTLEELKIWLVNNPVVIMQELKTISNEEITLNNYMHFPCHDFNTYCGNMYIGEGRNYILNDNKLPSENNLIINTEFREIDSAERLEDCKYKKSVHGYDTSYISSFNKNLLDISIDNILNILIGIEYTELENGFRVSNTITTIYSSIRYPIYLKAGVKYRINYNIEGQYAFVDLKTLTSDYICKLNRNTIFSVKNTGYYSVNFYCTGSTATKSTATFTNIIISEGETSVPFEPYIKSINYFENTESNDIEDLRHQVSLTGFNYSEILEKSFDSLLRGEL